MYVMLQHRGYKEKNLKGPQLRKKNWNPSDVEIQFFENISWSDAFDDFFFFIFNLGFIDPNWNNLEKQKL